MAKAYITASKRKGSVGGETYSVVKGQTIVKAKPVQVANPRSAGQMTQRSLFIDAVRFFQHSNQNYFKLAFEDKKQTESDYNAFMRSNAKLGVNITKKMSDDPRFPALGAWMVAKGSIASPAVSFYGDNYMLTADGLTSSNTTIGQLSAALKASYQLNESDIVTIVFASSQLSAVDTDTLECTYKGSSAVVWEVKQFKINSTSSTLISDVLGSDWSAHNGALWFNDEDRETACGLFVVFSRNTAAGLKVSTSRMIPNSIAAGIITSMQQPAFIEKVLADWNTSSEAILQGGL